MKNQLTTITIEDQYSPPFFNKIPISIDRGEGIYVWDEGERKYIDFTSGWGVTCLGHDIPQSSMPYYTKAGRSFRIPVPL